jgi:tetratricopeptide (TPR) repeat protein
VLLYEQGMTYADSRDYGRAVETFQDAIALNDDYAEAHNMLGFSLRQMGEYARAVDSYKRALALRPGYAEAHEYIGEAYLALDDLLHAMQHYLVLQRQRSTEAPELWAKIRTYVETRTRA